MLSCGIYSLLQVGGSALQVLLTATAGANTAGLSIAQTMQLLLLAQICGACDGNGDSSSPAAEESASLKRNVDVIEVVLAVVRTADQLPEVLFSLVKSCLEQLHLHSSRGAAGQLAEALPGEAPGCGELLKPQAPSHRSLR